MKNSIQNGPAAGTSRRGLLKAGAGLMAAAFWADEKIEAYQSHIQTASKPSELKITDLRVAWVAHAPMNCPLIRIDTNQGIYGLGEVRDGASKTYALMLKSRVLGENPCNVDRIFRKIKQFGGGARQGGGVCGIEMALWDLAGKAYNVPVYQMLGGKFRDKVRCYADTDESKDPHEYAQRLLMRKNLGFTWLKMDLGINLIQDRPGMVTHPLGMNPTRDTNLVAHPFTGVEITEKGIEAMCEYVAIAREAIGWDVPLSHDHFGHIGVNSCIRLGRALEKYDAAWLEDMVPWYYTDLLKEIKSAVSVPILTGEDIYLREGFETLCREHAVDLIHPDLATSGGILETHEIGNMAERNGVGMAMHFAGTPISCYANVHCAAATNNFLALENHSVEVPWWNDLVTGVEKPILNHGFITVPEKPGLGPELNDDVVKQHLLEPGYFEPTPEWNKERSWDRLYS
jgi:L-alanine-DL-glutamate epimerase-like enolase superfamily enzyme